MITSTIIDGNGNHKRLKIFDEGQIGVVQHNHPPKGESSETLPFREYFIDSAGSNSLNVDGSVTTVEYSISANNGRDLWVKTISVYIGDAGATLQEFGNLAALTNGVQMYWQTKEQGKVEIHEGIKTNLEWFRLSEQVPQIIDLSGAGADAVVLQIDFRKLLGVNWGLQLRKNSTDRLVFAVRDNLSTITNFNIIGYGIKI